MNIARTRILLTKYINIERTRILLTKYILMLYMKQISSHEWEKTLQFVGVGLVGKDQGNSAKFAHLLHQPSLSQ